MHIRLVNGETQHCDSAIGKALIAAKLAEEIPNTVKRPAHVTKWFVREGSRVEDYQYSPMVYVSCSCGLKQHTESERGTANEAVARHCGVNETCPPDVAAQYLKVFGEWKSRSRQKVKERVSAFTPGTNPKNLTIGATQPMPKVI